MKAKLEELCRGWLVQVSDPGWRQMFPRECETRRKDALAVLEIIASMEDAPLPGEVGARKECE